jgi:transcription elongation GreA/GreB family factor
MSRSAIGNNDFLERYLAHDPDLPNAVLLPHEADSVNEAVERQRKAFDTVVEQKVEVTGGDDWHDGAFRATDNEARIISQQMSSIAPFIGAMVVEYPELSEQRATLGSRLTIVQNNFTYPVDIVGFRAGYPEDVTDDETGEDVVGMSPESPLARLLIGGEVDNEFTFNSDGRAMPVKILRVDQLAVKQYFASHKQTVEITE